MAPRIVEIVLTGNATQAMAELQKLAGTSEASAVKMSNSFTNVGKFALLGLGAGVAAAAVIGVRAAQEQEQATARLKTAIENTGQSFKAYATEIGNAENKAIKLGFADDLLDTSLAKLAPVTKNVHEGIQLMSLAEDVARGRHIDLATATDILVKVQTGHVGLLGRIGIQTKDATGATISQEEAIKRLSTLYGGQASTFAGTFAGKLEIIKAQADELAEKIGFVLIPIIEGLGTALLATVNFFEQHRAAAIALAVVIGGPLVAAMTAYVVKQVEVAASNIVSFWAGMANVLRSSVLPSLIAVVAELALIAAPIAAAIAVGYALSKVFGGMVVDFKAAADAGKAHGAALAAQSSAIIDTGARLDQLKASLRDAKAEHIGSVAAAVSHNEAVKQLQAAIAALEGQQLAQANASSVAGTELEKLANGTKDLADASKDATTAIQNLQNVVLAAQGGIVGYEQAQANATEAQGKLTAAINEYGLASPEAAQAARDLQQANLGVSSAALKLSDDSTALAGTMNTKSIPTLEIMRQKLIDQAAAHGDASGAIAGEIGYIDGLIAKIQATPDSAHTTFYASVDQSFWDSVNSVSDAIANSAAKVVASVGSVFGARAAGGPVVAGGAYVVGERGPEMFVPNQSGTIVPNGGGAGLFDGATVYIGEQSLPDLDWFSKVHNASN